MNEALTEDRNDAGNLNPQTDFQIVPKIGLYFVAVVLVALVTAIATNSLWAIDFFHVVGGASWTILDLFLGFVLGPILGKLSIPARAEFTKRFMPKMLLTMPGCPQRKNPQQRYPQNKSRLPQRQPKIAMPRIAINAVMQCREPDLAMFALTAVPPAVVHNSAIMGTMVTLI